MVKEETDKGRGKEKKIDRKSSRKSAGVVLQPIERMNGQRRGKP